jgi:two-component system LytT family response regulator
MIRALIADDEPLAREHLRLALSGIPDLEICGEARDGPESAEAVLRLRPDLLLLDVQMPGFDGFEVVARTRETHLPAVVFVSAYDRHALRAFDVHAVDYLLKPYADERLFAAIERARASLSGPDPDRVRRLEALLSDFAPGLVPATFIDRFTIRDRDGWRFVRTEDVHGFTSAGNYVELHTADGSHLLRMTMSQLARSLDPRRFRRVHRTAIVNVNEVESVRPSGGEGFTVRLRSGALLRMSRRFRDQLLP